MTTSTTTVAPAEAGSTYPMPPTPAWASESRLDEKAIAHRRQIGEFRDESQVLLDGNDDHASMDVFVERFDTMDETVLTVGRTLVCFGQHEVTPAGARKLASLLIGAAAVAEQSS